MLGGMKYADGNVSVTGMYMKADTKDIYAAQVALRDSIGVSIMTSPDHDYYRGTFVLGGRTSPSHVSILLDYTKLGDFSGFGAMGTYYTAAGFDIAAGFSRQIELGINSTTMNLSTYYTTPKQNVMMGAKIGATQVGQFIWGTVRFELNVRF